VAVPERQLRLLQSIDLFRPLPPTTLERLAAQLLPVAAPPGTALVREGDAGDLFYMIAAGQVEVSRAGTPIRELGPGDYFGEIALIRDVPRGATCTAMTEAELFTVGRERFVSAVTGNRRCAVEIESVIDSRLAVEVPA
jgi:CRP-like cAMP-binding protein